MQLYGRKVAYRGSTVFRVRAVCRDHRTGKYSLLRVFKITDGVWQNRWYPAKHCREVLS